jgi:hypothetical protein
MNNELIAVLVVAFVRLRAKLWRSFALRFFSAYCRMIGFLCRSGVPAGLVNLTRLFVPDVLMRAGARAYQDEQQERERLVKGGA